MSLQKPLLPSLRDRTELWLPGPRISPAEATPTGTPCAAASHDCFDGGLPQENLRSSTASTRTSECSSTCSSPFGFGQEEDVSIVVDVEAGLSVDKQFQSSVQESSSPLQASDQSSATLDATPTHAPLTVAEATYTLVNWIMCSAVFSIPLIFSRSGFSAGLLIAWASATFVYTAWLMGEVMAQLETVGSSQATFLEAAQQAFGRGGAFCVSIVYHLELVSYGIANLIVQGRTLSDLIPGLSYAQAAALTAGICAIMSGVPDKVYAYISLLGVVSFWIACSMVFASAWELPEWSQGSRLTGDPVQLSSSFSTIMFCGAIHPLLPGLYASTKSKQDYERAAGCAYTVWGLFLVLFGAAAYYIYGDSVQAIVTQNIGRDTNMQKIPSLRPLATFSAWWVVCKIQLSSSNCLKPFIKSFADLLKMDHVSGKGGFKDMILSLPTLGVCLAAALLLEDSIESVISTSGMFLQNLNAVVFPTLIYLRVCNPKQITRWLSALAMFAFGVMLVAIPLSLRVLRAA